MRTIFSTIFMQTESGRQRVETAAARVSASPRQRGSEPDAPAPPQAVQDGKMEVEAPEAEDGGGAPVKVISPEPPPEVQSPMEDDADMI